MTSLNDDPHTLSRLATARGDNVHSLGDSGAEQPSGLTDKHASPRLGTRAIVDAGLWLLLLVATVI